MALKQRKKPKPLPEVLSRIRRMMKLIDKQVRVGLEVRSSLERANDLIIDLNHRQFPGAPCVTSIQGSQAMFLAMTR